MFNKKMLLSVFVIGLVSVLAGSTTWAYYQDTEISEDNNLSAGTLDLNLTTVPISVSNIEPGDSGSSTQSLKNEGSLTGELEILVDEVQNIESTGNTTYENDSIGTGGELGEFLEAVFWLDTNGNGVFNGTEDFVLLSSGDVSSVESDYNDASTSINNYNSITWDNVTTMAGSVEYDFVVEWDYPFGSEANNTTQGDSVTFDITFILEQSGVD